MRLFHLAILSGTLLILAGCAALLGGHAQPASKRYTLPAPATGLTAKQHFPMVLRVASVSAPTWLNTQRMIYRLDYQKKAPVAAYSRARWAAAPAALVAQALQNRLANSGLFKAVIGPQEAAAGLVLQVDLNDFEQRFSSRQHSFGVLDARATLLTPGTGGVIAQREFHYREPAPSADSAGGVTALGRASGRFTAAVGQWIQTTLQACAPGCLGSAASG